MTIEILNKTHHDSLTDFFLSLKKPTYYYWNRFGKLFTKEKAAKVSTTQVNLDPKQEIGFVAVENKVIMGYCYLRFFLEKEIKKYTTSLGIVVGDEFQGKGIGKQLMDFSLEYAKNNNFKKIWIATYTDNTRALRLYINLGFEIEGIFMYDEYLHGIPRHVVSMALFLDETCKQSKTEREQLIKKIQGR